MKLTRFTFKGLLHSKWGKQNGNTLRKDNIRICHHRPAMRAESFIV